MDTQQLCGPRHHTILSSNNKLGVHFISFHNDKVVAISIKNRFYYIPSPLTTPSEFNLYLLFALNYPEGISSYGEKSSPVLPFSCHDHAFCILLLSFFSFSSCVDGSVPSATVSSYAIVFGVVCPVTWCLVVYRGCLIFARTSGSFGLCLSVPSATNSDTDTIHE
jgi:hypothetical protein